MIRNRYFTLYQKVCLINALLASKIWYTGHVYPFPMKTAKLIEKEFFRFLWNSNKDHIQRDVVCSPKVNGGIGLINVFIKAKSIYIATTLRMLINSDYNSLIRYYMGSRVGNYIKFQGQVAESSSTNTAYFDYAILNFKKVHKIPKFPALSSKEIYKEMLPECKPRVEKIYFRKDWSSIWKI